MYDIEETSSVTLDSSDTIYYLYNEAAVGCTVYSNPESCQILANLCVLVLYNQGHPLCKLYRNSVSKAATIQTDYE